MRKIGMASATAVGLGAIIGAGIFVLSGTAISLAGPYALVAFIFVGLVALIMALVMSELSSIMPNAKGASYSYAYGAFGSEIAFITGILLYLSYATAAAAIALGFGSYLTSLLGIGFSLAPQALATLLLIALAIVNILGIRKAAEADVILVVIKVAILVVFIFFALFLASGTKEIGAANFSASGFGWSSFLEETIAIFFAYSGFQAITTFASRINGGSRAVAKALISAVFVSMIIYAFVIYALLLLAPASNYTIAADPLNFALASAHAPQILLIVVDVGAIIATTSAALTMMLSASRIVYQISSDRLLPRLLRGFDKKKDVAVNGVVASMLIGIVTLFSGNIYVIAAVSNFGLIVSYIIACIALAHFRRVQRRAEFRIPFYPYLPVIAIVAMLGFMLGMPREALVFGTISILALIVIYYFLREVKDKKVIRVKLFK